MYVPPDVFTKLSVLFDAVSAEESNAKLTYSSSYGIYGSGSYSCDSFYSVMPNIVIQLDDVVFTLPPKAYLVDDILTFSCGVVIASTGDYSSPYIMGDTFMRNFYVTFDFKNEKMELAVSANAPRGVTMEKKLWLKAVCWTAFALFILIIIICCLKSCYNKCCREAKKKTIWIRSGTAIGGDGKNRLLEGNRDIVVSEDYED